MFWWQFTTETERMLATHSFVSLSTFSFQLWVPLKRLVRSFPVLSLKKHAQLSKIWVKTTLKTTKIDMKPNCFFRCAVLHTSLDLWSSGTSFELANNKRVLPHGRKETLVSIPFVSVYLDHMKSWSTSVVSALVNRSVERSTLQRRVNLWAGCLGERTALEVLLASWRVLRPSSHTGTVGTGCCVAWTDGIKQDSFYPLFVCSLL